MGHRGLVGLFEPRPFPSFFLRKHCSSILRDETGHEDDPSVRMGSTTRRSRENEGQGGKRKWEDWLGSFRRRRLNGKRRANK